MKKAIFPGSFNPFTKGHESIVERALRIFDHLVIAIGCNSQKSASQENAARNCDAIAALYANNPRIEVTTYQGLTVDYAKEIGAEFIVRGVRNMRDFDYEREIADANRLLTGIETVLLFAETSKVHISSSLVRELQSYGKDIADYLPNTTATK